MIDLDEISLTADMRTLVCVVCGQEFKPASSRAIICGSKKCKRANKLKSQRAFRLKNPKRYEVVNVRTGERFGNHTYAEAVARAQAMRRNWNYKEQFKVVER